MEEFVAVGEGEEGFVGVEEEGGQDVAEEERRDECG